MGRGTWSWIVAAVLLGAGAAPAGAAVDATLRQIGCASSTAVTGCGNAAGIAGAGQPAVSHDGEHVYVPGFDDDALVDFKRDPATGVLTRLGCYGNAALGCVSVPGMDRPWAAAASPDGTFVYVVSSAGGSDGKLFVFQRLGDNLSQPVCFSAVAFGGCLTANAGALTGASTVFARNDSVYVASGIGTSNSVIGFRRLGNGTHEVANCVGAVGAGCAAESRFRNPTDIVVAPDGAHAYVSSYNFPDPLVVLNRAADGTLSPGASCVSFGNETGCSSRPAGRETIGLALSPDGRQLYAASQYQFGGGEAVEVFDVPADGSIAPRPGGCWSSALATPTPGCTRLQGLELSPDVVATPDGRAVFAASQDGTDTGVSADDGYVVSFARSGDGMLAPQPSPYGCLSTSVREGCGTLQGGGRVRHLAVTPDSRHLYAVAFPGAGTATRLLSFRIDRAPTCAPVGAATPFSTPALLQLACSDADGDPLAYEIVGQPQRGFLGSVQPDGRVPYAPFGGLSGLDSFTYRASAAGIAADPATATVDVQPPASTGGTPVGGGGPAAMRRIRSTVRPFWVEYRRYVVLRRLRITGVPAGGKVQVRCKGKGCPFKRRSFRVRKRAANASKATRKGKPQRGAVIQVRITKPGMIGKVVIYRVPKRGLPNGKIRCLPPGAAKPARC